MDPTKKLKKEIVAHGQLPWEMIEEILSRVCPKSLVRFRSVCKRWKAILDDKPFIYNHKETFRFILATKSKIYSVSIDPKIVVRELSLDIPGLEAQKPKKLVSCGEFMICSMGKGAAVCNPWLKQSTWINSEPSLNFYGICHRDSNNRSEESVYKTVWGKGREWKIHDLASGTWIDIRSKSSDSNQGEKKYAMHSTSGVFLNGTLFWIAFDETAFLYCLLSDFSTEGFYIYCELPCGRSHPSDVLVFNAFKGDRLSVLKQCHTTKKIEIWVTENKVEKGAGVVWINFMTFSIPNFPGLVTSYLLKPSYFIDSNERLVLCSCDETGKAWIYVMGGNKLIRKVHLDSVVDPWPLHCTYFPSLVPVPRSQRDVAESEV